MRRMPSADAAGAGEVPLALEEQQEGVAAELQQVAAVGVGDAEQRAERRADRLDELLGALAAAPREALGELREPGDVREQERGVERVDRRPGPSDEVAQHDVGDVGVQPPREARPVAIGSRARHGQTLRAEGPAGGAPAPAQGRAAEHAPTPRRLGREASGGDGTDGRPVGVGAPRDAFLAGVGAHRRVGAAAEALAATRQPERG